jgi:hypothetical protein
MLFKQAEPLLGDRALVEQENGDIDLGFDQVDRALIG